MAIAVKFNQSAFKHGVTEEYLFTFDTVDDLSADYLMTKAMATHKTPAEIIGEMVREKIAASV